MDGGDRASGCRLHERPQQRDEDSLGACGVFGAEAGAHHAGVQGIGGNGEALQSPGQFVAEQDVGQLGLVVGPCAEVAALALQVVEVDAAKLVGVGGDDDDAGGGAVLEPVEEQVGEQERREVVEGEGAFEPVRGEVSGVPVAPTLLTSASMRGRRPSTSPATRRTSDWADRSAMNASTGPPPAARISRTASCVR